MNDQHAVLRPFVPTPERIQITIRPAVRYVSNFVFLAAIVIAFIPLQSTFVYRMGVLALIALTISPLASGSISKFAVCRIFAILGLFSYSLYLIHNPLQSLLIRASVILGLPSLVAALALVAIPIIAAVLYYKAIESKSLALIEFVCVRAKTVNLI